MGGEAPKATSALRRALKHGLSLAFAIVCLWLALRNVALDQVSEALGGASPPWILLALALLITMNAVKCTKMGLLLVSVRRVGFRTLFAAETVAIMVDVAFPFRLQELVKSLLISRAERIEIGRVFGAVIADRAVAGVVLGALLVAVGLTHAMPPGADQILWSVAGGVVSITGVTILAVVLRSWSDAVLDRIAHLGIPGLARIAGFVGGVLSGLRSAASRPGILAAVLAITVAEWTLLGAAFWCVSWALGTPLGGEELLASVATVHVAFAIPSTTSGAIGIYEFAGKTTLVAAFGMDPEQALAVVFAFHAVLLVGGLIAGCLGLAVSRIGLAEVFTVKALAQSASPVHNEADPGATPASACRRNESSPRARSPRK